MDKTDKRAKVEEKSTERSYAACFKHCVDYFFEDRFVENERECIASCLRKHKEASDYLAANHDFKKFRIYS